MSNELSNDPFSPQNIKKLRLSIDPFESQNIKKLRLSNDPFSPQNIEKLRLSSVNFVTEAYHYETEAETEKEIMDEEERAHVFKFLQDEVIAGSNDEPQPALKVVGLFAGIGGIEAGLHAAGHASELLCEIEPSARGVLSHHFPDVAVHNDIRTLESIPEAGLLAAGFPCQDLSIAGRREGIRGQQSSLVGHVFRLLDGAVEPVKWLLLENVPFMLKLDKGSGMQYLVSELEQRGFRWAYRVVDTRAFGLPHRRQRVVLLASRTDDPWDSILVDDAKESPQLRDTESPHFGFYWTEGNRGIGWSQECVPPIKVGSGLGIPSSPAVWNSGTGEVIKLDIRDAERLQGFPVDWTRPAEKCDGRSSRWRLIGNSVSVPLGQWIGHRLRHPLPYSRCNDSELQEHMSWPDAAYGADGRRFTALASAWLTANELQPLSEFIQYPGEPLSPRAAAGLLYRIQKGSTKISDEFRETLQTLTRKEELRQRFHNASKN